MFLLNANELEAHVNNAHNPKAIHNNKSTWLMVAMTTHES